MHAKRFDVGGMYNQYNTIVLLASDQNYVISNLSDDRSNASSKTVPPHSAI